MTADPTYQCPPCPQNLVDIVAGNIRTQCPPWKDISVHNEQRRNTARLIAETIWQSAWVQAWVAGGVAALATAPRRIVVTTEELEKIRSRFPPGD